MSDVFISYARGDRARAEILANALERRNLSVWWDPDILPGEQFSQTIQQEIAKAKCVIVLWSETSVNSKWVQNEAREGARRDILVPALIDNVDIPLEFSGADAANLVDWEETLPHGEFGRLLNAVRAMIDRPLPLKQPKLNSDWRRISRIEQRLRSLQFREISVVVAVVAGILVFFLFWVNLFDRFNLDAEVESYTIIVGDLFAHKQFHDDIVMIRIDETVEKQVGREFDISWRKEHAKLINHLSKAGAKVVVFDMYFEDDSREFDEKLSEAVTLAGKQEGMCVIVGVGELEDGQPILAEKLKSAATGWGALVAGTKVGRAWVTALAIKKKDQELRTIPGLALQAFAAYKSGQSAQIEDFDPNSNKIKVRFGSEAETLQTLRFFHTEEILEYQAAQIVGDGDLVANLAIDRTPRCMLRDWSRSYSYADVWGRSDPNTLTQFRDKIVVVGVAIEREPLRDFHGDRWGFELQADAINTLLNGVVIRPVAPSDQFALMVILGILAAIIRTTTRNRSKRLRILLLIVVLMIYIVVTICLYVQDRLLLNVVYPVGALFLTYWVVGKLERRYFQ
jgi:CHASE2 domain-containing sensor protein